jgi:di/tricarboxylate transporter
LHKNYQKLCKERVRQQANIAIQIIEFTGNHMRTRMQMILLFTALLAALLPFNSAKSATLEIASRQQQIPNKISKSYLLVDNQKSIIEERIDNATDFFDSRRRRRTSRNSDSPPLKN